MKSRKLNMQELERKVQSVRPYLANYSIQLIGLSMDDM